MIIITFSIKGSFCFRRFLLSSSAEDKTIIIIIIIIVIIFKMVQKF